MEKERRGRGEGRGERKGEKRGTCHINLAQTMEPPIIRAPPLHLPVRKHDRVLGGLQAVERAPDAVSASAGWKGVSGGCGLRVGFRPERGERNGGEANEKGWRWMDV